MLKRILVALSGTPYTESAIQHAVALARVHGAEVTGVTVTDLGRLANVGPIPIGAAAAAHDLAEHRIQITEERINECVGRFESACGESGVACAVAREAGDPVDELMSLWRYHDLTVLGLRGLFEYGIVHNPDDLIIRLVRHGVRPILSVSREPHIDIQRVLIGYNGSMESAKAMKRFAQSRLWPDAAARIVCFDRKEDEGNTLLTNAAAYCRAHGMDVETDLVDGNPRDRLLPYAETYDADLIVMGSTSRKRIFQHILGDVVLTAIRESPRPLYMTQ